MNSTQFREIFYPYHTKLYRIAYRMLMDAPQAEDMVQEVFLKLWSNRQELEEIENTEAYAVIMLKNMCLNQLRLPNNKASAEYDYEIAETSSLSAQVETRDGLHKLRQLIDRLPDQQRQAILLRHSDGYSYQEMEQMTGLNTSHLRVLISRARKTIREQFIKIK